MEIFTRDLKRITEQFPEVVAAARSMKDEVILDGEIIAYAEDKKLTFHDLQKRLGRRDQGDLFISSDITVRFVAFDILWQDGTGLLHEPLETRRAHLERLDLPPLLQRIAISSAGSAAEIESAFHAARRAGNEGLIAKDRHSPYTPGRRGKTWLKLKKAFSTLDVVVVKAEQGHGKRSHVLSDYTFAVRDEESGALQGHRQGLLRPHRCGDRGTNGALHASTPSASAATCAPSRRTSCSRSPSTPSSQPAPRQRPRPALPAHQGHSPGQDPRGDRHAGVCAEAGGGDWLGVMGYEL